LGSAIPAHFAQGHANLFIDAFFIADIFVVSRTGYIVDGVMKLDRESLRAYYPRFTSFMSRRVLHLLRLHEAHQLIPLSGLHQRKVAKGNIPICFRRSASLAAFRGWLSTPSTSNWLADLRSDFQQAALTTVTLIGSRSDFS
jgi:hypothetical protein